MTTELTTAERFAIIDAMTPEERQEFKQFLDRAEGRAAKPEANEITDDDRENYRYHVAAVEALALKVVAKLASHEYIVGEERYSGRWDDIIEAVADVLHEGTMSGGVLDLGSAPFGARDWIMRMQQIGRAIKG